MQHAPDTEKLGEASAAPSVHIRRAMPRDYPLLPVRRVVYPSQIATIAVGRPRAVDSAHDAALAQRCDRVVRLRSGRIDGPTTDRHWIETASR